MIKNFVLFVLLLLCSINANATTVARPVGGDNRIKIVNFTPNTVFKFMGHYEYQSIIEFGIDEEIETISMGTPTPWQIVPAGNRIFVKPVEDNATTNMTVITNKRMYFFEMHAQEADGVNDDTLTFVMKFVYPDSNGGISNLMASNTANSSAASAAALGGPDLNKPENYNFKYSISGSGASIEPLMVFDDGKFTYLKFKDVNAELPAIFLVSPNGEEGLVNYRVNYGYIIVERVAARFTLRHGSEVICLFNERSEYANQPFNEI